MTTKKTEFALTNSAKNCHPDSERGRHFQKSFFAPRAALTCAPPLVTLRKVSQDSSGAEPTPSKRLSSRLGLATSGAVNQNGKHFPDNKFPDNKFSEHVAGIVRKTSLICKWIMRTFVVKNSSSYLRMFQSHVMPILTYCSVICSPSARGPLEWLENVQRK